MVVAIFCSLGPIRRYIQWFVRRYVRRYVCVVEGRARAEFQIARMAMPKNNLGKPGHVQCLRVLFSQEGHAAMLQDFEQSLSFVSRSSIASRISHLASLRVCNSTPSEIPAHVVHPFHVTRVALQRRRCFRVSRELGANSNGTKLRIIARLFKR